MRHRLDIPSDCDHFLLRNEQSTIGPVDMFMPDIKHSDLRVPVNNNMAINPPAALLDIG